LKQRWDLEVVVAAAVWGLQEIVSVFLGGLVVEEVGLVPPRVVIMGWKEDLHLLDFYPLRDHMDHLASFHKGLSWGVGCQ